MRIPSIPRVLQVLRAQPRLERTAAEMARSPRVAASKFGELLDQIHNGHALGVGYGSGNALEAGVTLKRFVETVSAGQGTPPSPGDFAKLLVHVGQLEVDLRRQLDAPPSTQARQELQRTVAITVGLQNFRGTKP